MPALLPSTVSPAPRNIAEHSMVRLINGLDAEGIEPGATGAVAHVYDGGENYEVECLVEGRSKLATVPSEELELIDRA